MTSLPKNQWRSATYKFNTWLERREPDQEDIKDALIGAIPDKVKSAAGVSGSSEQDKELLLGKPIGIWERDNGIVNAILQQGVIKSVLTPEKIDQIQGAVRNDEGNNLTFKDILDMILGGPAQGAEVSTPQQQAPAPEGGPPPGQPAQPAAPVPGGGPQMPQPPMGM